jgi:starch synthase
MLAMRSGQPCLVHSVGGLKDTVKDGVDGFGFSGEDVVEQVNNFQMACRRATDMKRENPNAWGTLIEHSMANRFLWDATITEYCTKLYGRNVANPVAAQVVS